VLFLFSASEIAEPYIVADMVFPVECLTIATYTGVDAMARANADGRERHGSFPLSPHDTRGRIQAFHANRLRLSDKAIDQMFGISPDVTEQGLDRLDLLSRYGNEQFEGDGLSYREIRRILIALQPCCNDVVYDLGAGYGRFLIYGATIFQATFKGVEIVAERARVADQARRLLQLTNLEIVTSNVVDAEIWDGSKFYLFSPFFTKTLEMVIEKLHVCAMRRAITIAALYHSASLLAREKWLTEVRGSFSDEVLSLRIFESRIAQ
jgi:hypothetical protein